METRTYFSLWRENIYKSGGWATKNELVANFCRQMLIFNKNSQFTKLYVVHEHSCFPGRHLVSFIFMKVKVWHIIWSAEWFDVKAHQWSHMVGLKPSRVPPSQVPPIPTTSRSQNFNGPNFTQTIIEETVGCAVWYVNHTHYGLLLGGLWCCIFMCPT